MHAFDNKQTDPFENQTRISHTIDPTVKTITFKTLGKVDKPKFESWLQSLLWNNQIPNNPTTSINILRFKAKMNFDDGDVVNVVQAVQELYDIQEGREWEDFSKKENKLVFIGSGLDQEEIKNSFLLNCMDL